jgi:hypothetical protein
MNWLRKDHAYSSNVGNNGEMAGDVGIRIPCRPSSMFGNATTGRTNLIVDLLIAR